MRTDAIIVGAELDGLVAAIRLSELGYVSRIFATGAGSMHYGPAGLRVLGHLPSSNEEAVLSPLQAIPQLEESHPYRKLGVAKVKTALDWFTAIVSAIHQPITINDSNEFAVSSIGLDLPIYGIGPGQATFKDLAARSVVIVQIRGYQNLPVEVLCAALRRQGFKVDVVEVDAPGELLENAALAKSFDGLDVDDAFVARLKKIVPTGTEVILLPAVIGLGRSCEKIYLLESALGAVCLEVPTLPPSVPGIRLERAFNNHLKSRGTTIHMGARIEQCSHDDDEIIVVHDQMGRRYEAAVAVVSSGGVLMGGLDVDSHGRVHETSFGLDTFQSNPLVTAGVEQSLHALHTAGVETDDMLRPRRNGSGLRRNLFVTGRTLAHWNPGAESSSDGVCVATGWAAAENAHRYLEAMANE